MPRRPDGELIKTSKFHELQFHIMRGRTESTIYFDTQVDLTHTIEFVEEYNKNKEDKDKLTLFQIYLAAGARAITLRPKMNRFISGRRLWQRNQIIFSFVVSKDKSEGGEEVNAMIEFDPFDTLETVQKKVYYEIYDAKYGENRNEKDVKMFGSMPRLLIRFIFWFARWMDEHNMPLWFLAKDIPFWSTAYVAHLGSLGIDAVFHHNFEMGTVGMFFALGKMKKAMILNQETEKNELRTVMDVRVTIDDRIAYGSYSGPSIYLLKDLIENPEPLLEPPKLTDEQLDKLMLKKYKKERLQREKERKKQERKNKKK